MAWGGGVFTRTYGSTAWQTDASNSVGIVADRHDTNDQDLADGINACINKAGGNTPTADLPMGGYKHTNLSAGSAAAPTFCAGNDQDTGMYSPGANRLGFATGGVIRFEIDASGNSYTSGAAFFAPTGGEGGEIRLANAAGAYNYMLDCGPGNEIRYRNANNTDQVFLNNSVERVRFTAAGNVSIGWYNPSAKLTVAGVSPNDAGAATNPGTIQLNEQGITNLTTTGGLEFKGSASGSGYGSKLLGLDNGSLVFLYRNNSATWTEAARIDTTGRVGIGTNAPSYLLQLNTDSAAKPTTNTWTIASDERIKTNIQPYEKGLAEILQVEPITYDYNGKGGIPAGPGGISILAQALQPIFPECIGSYKGKLNEEDEEDTDILNYNGHAMTFALINAVKELSTKLDALTDRVTALEA